jgi:TolA-binding protein
MIALLVLLVASPAPAGQRAFDAAIAREAGGDYRGAADALERLGHDQPDDPFADDALFEAAQLSEERLADPARAARLYAEVATKYPQSRLSRRARVRADFLAASLRTGAQPLAEYQRIVGDSSRKRADAIADMQRLLRERPDFALADRALYWLGSRLVEEKREAEGVAAFVELERRFPSSEWAPRAKKARADRLLGHGRLDDAQQLYAELGRERDPIAQAASREGLAAVRGARLRRGLSMVAAIWLLIFAGLQLVPGGWRQLKHVPLEVLYYLPVAALFALAGLTEHGAIAAATAGIGLGGMMITWLAAAGTAARVGRGSVGRVEQAARAAALALAVLSLAYLAVETAGLTDLVLETLRSGPER